MDQKKRRGMGFKDETLVSIQLDAMDNKSDRNKKEKKRENKKN